MVEIRLNIDAVAKRRVAKRRVTKRLVAKRLFTIIDRIQIFGPISLPSRPGGGALDFRCSKEHDVFLV